MCLQVCTLRISSPDFPITRCIESHRQFSIRDQRDQWDSPATPFAGSTQTTFFSQPIITLKKSTLQEASQRRRATRKMRTAHAICNNIKQPKALLELQLHQRKAMIMVMIKTHFCRYFTNEARSRIPPDPRPYFSTMCLSRGLELSPKQYYSPPSSASLPHFPWTLLICLAKLSHLLKGLCPPPACRLQLEIVQKNPVL